MSSSSLAQWLQRLESIHPAEIELGLERVSRVARALQLLPVPQPVVTIGGTNGKGSTVAVLDALLRECGYRTGTFTSPHLLRFNERIRVDGIEVSDASLVAAFDTIDAARQDVSLTYFEFATLAALLEFRAQTPDILLLEVGLGGRLDAVNIVDTSVAVITSIDLDHQAWLGDTRGAIAREKAGIMRLSVPVVIADPEPPVDLVRCIEAMGARPALYLGRDFTATVEQGMWRGSVVGNDGRARSLGNFEQGSLLPENICAAVQAAELLGVSVSNEVLQRALSLAAPPGRRQSRKVAGLDYVLDVAHNPAAVRKLIEHLGSLPSAARTICVFSAMADKDIEGMVAATGMQFDMWFLGDQPGNRRAAAAGDIAAVLRGAGHTRLSVSGNLPQAFRRAQGAAAAGDRLVVFGSFHTVAAALPLLDQDAHSHEVN